MSDFLEQGYQYSVGIIAKSVACPGAPSRRRVAHRRQLPSSTYLPVSAGFTKRSLALGSGASTPTRENPAAAETYERNHCIKGQQGEAEAEGSSGGGGGITRVDQRDILAVVAEHTDSIPAHTVLTAGFPCQPFSSNGRGAGFRCARHGDHLQSRIARVVVAARRPPFVLLLEKRAGLQLGPVPAGARTRRPATFAALGYPFPPPRL